LQADSQVGSGQSLAFIQFELAVFFQRREQVGAALFYWQIYIIRSDFNVVIDTCACHYFGNS